MALTLSNAIFCVSLPVLLAQAHAMSGAARDAPWRDAVSYRIPDDPLIKNRLQQSASWLVKHAPPLAIPGQPKPVRLIAWKDPTLEPESPKLLAGYLITDTLWSAKALNLFDPILATEMEQSLNRLGWYGNGLHDVLFHAIDKLRHRPSDRDIVHGDSLGRFPAPDGCVVDVRVFRQQWDARFDVGHPAHFAEHAIYAALNDFWHGRAEPARKRVLEVIAKAKAADQDRIFWDDQAGILVDYVNLRDWTDFHEGKRPVCRHFTFKLGVLLYATRVLGMENDIGAPLRNMRRRLWSAQTESGGVAHYVDVQGDGKGTAGLEATGEASAIAILAEVVDPVRSGLPPR